MDARLSRLPLPDLRDDRLDGAECLFDPELHDGPSVAEGPQERAAREDVARQICATCPVRKACEKYALRMAPKRGIWAGRTAAQVARLVSAGAKLGEVA